MAESNSIRWLGDPVPVSREAVLNVARALHVVFPDDYLECVIANSGGYPLPQKFDFGTRRGAVFNYLLSFHGARRDPQTPEILYKHRILSGRLPDKVIPVASDPGGNFICLDYRDAEHSPRVVFWDHEDEENPKSHGISNICASFGELLRRLHD